MSTRLFFFCLVLLASVSETFAQPQLFFQGNEDMLWSDLIGSRCTIIENVPIVARSRNLSAQDAILSSIVGYYERRFPIFGPPLPNRVEQLVFEVSKQQRLNDQERDGLAKILYELEEKNFKTFRVLKSEYPQATEGAVRGHFLRKLPQDNLELTFQMAAGSLQTIKVDRLPTVQYTLLARAADAQKPAIIRVDKGRFVYASIGHFEGHLAVIDSDSAKPLTVPAENVLLTEQDRKSSGDFAVRARELLKNETIALDEISSCKTNRRPAGIRFLDPSKLSREAEIFIIQDWALDTTGLVKRIPK